MKELAQEALEQIKRKGYIAKYQADRRPVTTVSVCFDGQTRGVGCMLGETVNPPVIPDYLLFERIQDWLVLD